MYRAQAQGFTWYIPYVAHAFDGMSEKENLFQLFTTQIFANTFILTHINILSFLYQKSDTIKQVTPPPLGPVLSPLSLLYFREVLNYIIKNLMCQEGKILYYLGLNFGQ